MEKELGHGNFGIVNESRWKGKKVAVKRFSPKNKKDDNDRNHDKFVNEGLILFKLSRNHNHRGHFPEVYEATDNKIVMELVRGGNLETYLNQNSKIAIEKSLDLGTQLLEALTDLRGAGLSHRDLKPENILLKNGRLILTDFGVASNRTLTVTSPCNNSCSGPESLRNDHNPQKADVESGLIVIASIISPQYTKWLTTCDHKNILSAQQKLKRALQVIKGALSRAPSREQDRFLDELDHLSPKLAYLLDKSLKCPDHQTPKTLRTRNSSLKITHEKLKAHGAHTKNHNFGRTRLERNSRSNMGNDWPMDARHTPAAMGR